MPVFRVEKNSNYTTMCNYHLRDQGLSLKGKGLLSMLLSLPDTWNYSVRGLSSITPDGVDGVLTALKELERLGYLERNQQRESNGRMGRAEYVIYEMPRKKPCSESPCTEKPYTVNPDTDTPVTENPAQLSTNRTSTETINKREKKEIQHRYGSYGNVLLSDTEFNFLKANGNRISGSISTTMRDYIINYQDLQGIGMTGKLALPTLIALCSIALGRPTVSTLAVLGEISISGTILKVDELANSLQVCLDSGAKKVLLPITSAADLGTVPPELVGSFNLIFYSSAEDAVFKALGVE